MSRLPNSSPQYRALRKGDIVIASSEEAPWLLYVTIALSIVSILCWLGKKASEQKSSETYTSQKAKAKQAVYTAAAGKTTSIVVPAPVGDCEYAAKVFWETDGYITSNNAFKLQFTPQSGRYAIQGHGLFPIIEGFVAANGEAFWVEREQGTNEEHLSVGCFKDGFSQFHGVRVSCNGKEGAYQNFTKVAASPSSWTAVTAEKSSDDTKFGIFFASWEKANSTSPVKVSRVKDTSLFRGHPLEDRYLHSINNKRVSTPTEAVNALQEAPAGSLLTILVTPEENNLTSLVRTAAVKTFTGERAGVHFVKSENNGWSVKTVRDSSPFVGLLPVGSSILSFNNILAQGVDKDKLPSIIADADDFITLVYEASSSESQCGEATNKAVVEEPVPDNVAAAGSEGGDHGAMAGESEVADVVGKPAMDDMGQTVSGEVSEPLGNDVASEAAKDGQVGAEDGEAAAGDRSKGGAEDGEVAAEEKTAAEPEGAAVVSETVGEGMGQSASGEVSEPLEDDVASEAVESGQVSDDAVVGGSKALDATVGEPEGVAVVGEEQARDDTGQTANSEASSTVPQDGGEEGKLSTDTGEMCSRLEL